MSKKIAFVLTPTNEELLTKYMTYAPYGCKLNVSYLLNELPVCHLSHEACPVRAAEPAMRLLNVIPLYV